MRRHLATGLSAVALALVWSACSSSPGNGAAASDGGRESRTEAGATRGGSGSSRDSGGQSSSGGTGDRSSGRASTATTGTTGTPESASSDGGVVLPSGRTFPDTYGTIAILTDQLPSGMPAAQQNFAATHYVGTEKQLLPDTKALRAINKDFIVLHYHLAMWQSAVDFIVNGTSWGNDLSTVTMNETWFWHNASSNTSSGRVTASDGKFLMDITVQGFADYWVSSLEQQVADGEYDGIMFDSASPSLLQGWCGGMGMGQDPRLAGTAAETTPFDELDQMTWIAAWDAWIRALSGSLAAKGIPVIPNDGAFITGWDTTNYSLSAGVFSEGFGDPTFAESDWQAATSELLSLSAADKIIILQNYLSTAGDIATRMYYLGNYLLVKAHHTYLDYFDSNGPLEWYPEWSIDLGTPTSPPAGKVSDLLSGGVYQRTYTKGLVLVNPSGSSVTVKLGGTYKQVVPTGGGQVDPAGDSPGTVGTMSVTSVTLAATSAAVLLH